MYYGSYIAIVDSSAQGAQGDLPRCRSCARHRQPQQNARSTYSTFRDGGLTCAKAVEDAKAAYDEVNSKYNYLAEYNPERAMELLEEAGFKDVNGDGFVENPDGSEINFDIHVVNGWTDWVQTVQMVSEFLAEVGIKANTKTVDWSVYDNALKEGTYQASINWSRTNGEDPIQA